MGGIELIVKIRKVLWRDILTGKALVNVEIANSSERCTCAFQNFGDYDYGLQLELLEYEETEHPLYGKNLAVKKYRLLLTTMIASLEYLQMALGMKAIDAKKIVDFCNGNIYHALVEQDGITTLKNLGFSDLKAATIVDSLKTTASQQELLEFLIPYGGNYPICRKVFKQYGYEAIKEIKENPYLMIDYGFKLIQCDKLAKDLGIEADSDFRIDAIVRTILKAEHMCGHVFSCTEDILAKRKYLKNDVYPDTVTSAMIVAHIEQEHIIRDHDLIYYKYMHYAETNTAKQILRLSRNGVSLPFDDGLIDWAESECSLSYAPQQREAFSILKRSGVAVITGGPGTGKTTVINGLLMAYEQMNPDGVIKLCAPTGRAAQRITESTGRIATTIHRLLEFKPFGRKLETVHNADNPIVADIIIVDECSMLDIELASLFFSAVSNGTLVILVGDINQLPSVGAGDVLHDIIESEVVPVTKLQTVYRQSGTSPIVANANAINDGLERFIEDDDFVISRYFSDDEIASNIVNYMIENFDPADPFAVQVLVPSRVGKAGLTELNFQLQNALNPITKGVQYGKTLFRVNDKVLLTRNNYEIGYFNGDIGIITEAKNGQLTIDLQGNIIQLSKELLDDVMLAYAMTVHKSQGSEFKEAIVVLPNSPANMLKRNLFYTAVTRAKKKVWVVATKGSIPKAIMTSDTGKRRTKLSERLRNNGFLEEELEENKL